jgi:hypothetical protein
MFALSPARNFRPTLPTAILIAAYRRLPLPEIMPLPFPVGRTRSAQFAPRLFLRGRSAPKFPEMRTYRRANLTPLEYALAQNHRREGIALTSQNLWRRPHEITQQFRLPLRRTHQRPLPLQFTVRRSRGAVALPSFGDQRSTGPQAQQNAHLQKKGRGTPRAHAAST